MRDESPPADPATRARQLILKLRQKHSVSDRFAAECRTAVESILSEFEGTERDRLLAVVEASMQRQARVQEVSQESYRALNAVSAGLARQVQALQRLTEKRERLRQQAEALAVVAPSRSRLLH